jgi:hypothetical protein
MILFGLPIVGIDSGFVRIMARLDDRGRSLPTKRIEDQDAGASPCDEERSLK